MIRVLHIDDEASIRLLSRVNLEAAGFDLCAIDYITKPFNPVELAPCVRALLSRLERSERDELRREKMFQLLQDAEGGLREHSPADFETTANAAAECVDAVCFVEEEEWWRVGYDSLASFYAAHEARHPDIRVYAAVRREIPMAYASMPPEGIGEVIAQRIALHREQPTSEVARGRGRGRAIRVSP